MIASTLSFERLLGTSMCCLDPHRRHPPTRRTTRYSVFKERPRPWKLVSSSLRQTCADRIRSSGQESHCESSRSGRRNLRERSLPVKALFKASRAFFQRPLGIFRNALRFKPSRRRERTAFCPPEATTDRRRCDGWGPRTVPAPGRLPLAGPADAPHSDSAPSRPRRSARGA